MGTLADKRKRRHGENTLKARKNQFSLPQKVTNYCEEEGKKRRRKRESYYSREHDSPAYPALFPISPHSSTGSSHACQVALSPILQVMNYSHSRTFTRDNVSNEK